MTRQRNEHGFDPKLKQLAKAEDAVDRLKALADDFRAEQERRERIRDYAARAVLLVLLAAVVAYAVAQ